MSDLNVLSQLPEQIPEIQDWEEWQARWQQLLQNPATTTAEFLGMLHCSQFILQRLISFTKAKKSEIISEILGLLMEIVEKNPSSAINQKALSIVIDFFNAQAMSKIDWTLMGRDEPLFGESLWPKIVACFEKEAKNISGLGGVAKSRRDRVETIFNLLLCELPQSNSPFIQREARSSFGFPSIKEARTAVVKTAVALGFYDLLVKDHALDAIPVILKELEDEVVRIADSVGKVAREIFNYNPCANPCEIFQGCFSPFNPPESHKIIALMKLLTFDYLPWNNFILPTLSRLLAMRRELPSRSS